MKRILLILLCITLLTGCASLAPDSYHSVTPHAVTDSQTASADAAEASDFHGLKIAILNQVRSGRPEGTIRVYNYDGDLEADLSKAAYEISSTNPIGAYAVEYMTHSLSRLVSYHDIHISINFRRSAAEIAQIKTVSSTEELQDQLAKAIDTFGNRIAIQLNDYDGQADDISDFVTEYCITNPHTVMEIPEVTVSVYPQSGASRIVETNFRYVNNPQGLQAKRRAVENSISAAAEYIRYQQEDYGKIQLLYSYLAQRFEYREGETVTPLYDALCSGIADPTGLAQAWKLICDRADVECHIVSGLKNNQPYTWNIFKLGGYYRHLDLAQCIRQNTGLAMASDVEMNATYYWNMEQYPACRTLPAAQQTETAPPEDTQTETDPSEGESSMEETTVTDEIQETPSSEEPEAPLS